MQLVVLIFLLVSSLHLKLTGAKIRNGNDWILDKDDVERCLRSDVPPESCKNVENWIGFSENVIKRKDNNGAALSSEAEYFDDNEEIERQILKYQPIHEIPCSCKIEYIRIFLGEDSYPRSYRTGICKATKRCPHRCVPRVYSAWILKPKSVLSQMTATQDWNMLVPYDLRDSWESQRVNITVACDCIP